MLNSTQHCVPMLKHLIHTNDICAKLLNHVRLSKIVSPAYLTRHFNRDSSSSPRSWPVVCFFPNSRYAKGHNRKVMDHQQPGTRKLLSTKTDNVMNVFDRKTKRMQRNLTANLVDFEKYEYLREEFGWRMADRISDVKRKFEVAVDIGCGRGYIGRHCYSDMIGTLYQMDVAEKLLDKIEPNTEIKTVNMVGDEEFFPFKENSLDLVISSLNLHWVNDLPGTFLQIFKALKGDGCFMGAMFGGDTLFELRCSLQLAETEREGGFAPHISPFTSVQDLGNLLNRAGYVMLTIDIDELVVNYPSMFELMQDLKGMGENNCQWSRRLLLPRETQMAAAAVYKEMYGSKEEDSVPATFQVICFIAWKPDSSQPKLAKRGSGQVSIKDVDKLDKLTQQVKEMQKDIKGSTLDKTIDKLNKDIERLKQTVKDDQEKDK